jgi:hypothetical protein
MSRLRTAGTVAGVIAAMAVGRVVTDHLPADGQAQEPFVRSGAVGDRISTEYADVTVYDVRVADFLVGIDPIAARGAYVVVDVKAHARHRSSSLRTIELHAPDGTIFGLNERGTACSGTVWLNTGATTYARLCFDVPTDALPGLHLHLNREGALYKGEVARDEVIDIDLGIDEQKAKQLVAERLTLDGPNDPLVKPDPSPLPEPSAAPEEAS